MMGANNVFFFNIYYAFSQNSKISKVELESSWVAGSRGLLLNHLGKFVWGDKVYIRYQTLRRKWVEIEAKFWPDFINLLIPGKRPNKAIPIKNFKKDEKHKIKVLLPHSPREIKQIGNWKRIEFFPSLN
jgi:hypothetical protein